MEIKKDEWTDIPITDNLKDKYRKPKFTTDKDGNISVEMVELTPEELKKFKDMEKKK